MRRVKWAMAVGAMLCASNVASADNFIEKWGGNGAGYSIDQQTQTILITAAGEYKF